MKSLPRFNLLISVINLTFLACFWYRYASPTLNSIIGFSSSDFLAAQANHNAILQIHLVIFSIFLAILGFFGYNTIKKGAERTAEEGVEKALNELVPKLVKEQIEKLGPERIYPFHLNRTQENRIKSSHFLIQRVGLMLNSTLTPPFESKIEAFNRFACGYDSGGRGIGQMLVELKVPTPLKKNEDALSDEIRIKEMMSSLEE